MKEIIMNELTRREVLKTMGGIIASPLALNNWSIGEERKKYYPEDDISRDKPRAIRMLSSIQNEHTSDYEISFSQDLIQRIFDKTVLFDLVSVQPVYQGSQEVYRLDSSSNVCETQIPENQYGVSPSRMRFTVSDNKILDGWLNYYKRSMTEDEAVLKVQEITEEFRIVCASELQYEIERRVIQQLRQLSNKESWDFYTAPGDTIKEKYEDLYMRIDEISKTTGANWIVTSPEIASIFEVATAGFMPAPTPTHLLGIQEVGTINNRWRLYRDPLYPVNQALLGRFDKNTAYENYFIYTPTCLVDNGIMDGYLEGETNPYTTLNIDNFIL